MKYIIFFLVWLVNTTSIAQILIRSLKSSTNSNARIALKKQTNEPITLPFWDDFYGNSKKLDTKWWLPKSQLQVIIKTGIGINPPTIGVASFDGVNAEGLPYFPSPVNGGADSLVSQPIDLTKVSPKLRKTVYLSFYYQFAGLGEAPETKDSLVLYFKNIDEKWDKIWPKKQNNYITNRSIFTQVFTQVSELKYFHSTFQFMFKATGKKNGWLDNWLLDYVYMDKRRTANDNSYLDRAFSSPPLSIFDLYTTIPFDDFKATVDKKLLFKKTKANLRNLESDIQPIEYSVNLYDTLNKTLIEKIVKNEPQLLRSKSLITLSSKAINPALLNKNADSLFLMLEYYVKSGDKFLIDSIYNNGADTAFYTHINLRKNDTLKRYFNLHNYYSYDDGTAEYGAGINQPKGKIAIKFNVLKGKYLNRIDMYFPNIQENQVGTPFELFVLKNLEGNKNSILFQSKFSVSHKGINQFITYKLATPVFVKGTFFIGFTNLSSNDDWLTIGLDKNTNSSNKIYVNINGNWNINNTVQGSLMMRPYFTEKLPTLGIKKSPKIEIDAYPNPSNGYLTIKGNYISLMLYDILGRPVDHKMVTHKKIFFQVKNPQILMLRIKTYNGTISKRIIAFPFN